LVHPKIAEQLSVCAKLAKPLGYINLLIRLPENKLLVNNYAKIIVNKILLAGKTGKMTAGQKNCFPLFSGYQK